MIVNYELAYAEACRLLGLAKPGDVARRSRSAFDGHYFTVRYLGRDYRIAHPSGTVESEGLEAVPIVDRILILHYLLNATGVPLSGREISFKEVPGGLIYLRPYEERVIRPLVRWFGADPSSLVVAAAGLGGVQGSRGDACVTIPVFPMLPLTFILWRGDEELPPSGSVLYDSTASFYLPTEDLVVVALQTLLRLRQILISGLNTRGPN